LGLAMMGAGAPSRVGEMSQLVAKMIMRRRDSLRPLSGRKIPAAHRLYIKSLLSQSADTAVD